MEIYAKAALDARQIEVKQHIGCDGIEIQLLGELLEKNPSGMYREAEETWNLSDFDRVPVKAVHAPLVSSFDLTLEKMTSTGLFPPTILYNACKVAEHFGRRNSGEIPVVVHTELAVDDDFTATGMYSEIRTMIDRALKTYPHVIICIENVTPLRGMSKCGLSLSNNFAGDNVFLVKALLKDLKTDRIGTVFDTCHAMIAAKYVNALCRGVGVLAPDLSLEHFIMTNRGVCKLIHLAGMKGSGYGGDNHGIPFSEQNEELCREILDLYQKYEYNCPVTLEVSEADYLTCDGYRVTKETVERILNEMATKRLSA